MNTRTLLAGENPDGPGPDRLAAERLLQRGLLKRAEKAFAALARRGDARSASRLARALALQGRHEAALKALSAAIRLSPAIPGPTASGL
ncbi:MAG: hypothetical protein M0D55_08690 [Elusimicrobiota bacterium]|nr:MAG: hypothetical protein M0D55_08690 [Elusimicrobiota bacterium]